jgi:hypothetical protein
MRDFGEERVHPPTLCPNSDVSNDRRFANSLGDLNAPVNEALKAVREGEISDEWSATCNIH